MSIYQIFEIAYKVFAVLFTLWICIDIIKSETLIYKINKRVKKQNRFKNEKKK